MAYGGLLFGARDEGLLGETLMATPAIAGGTLYRRPRGHLYAIAEAAAPRTP